MGYQVLANSKNFGSIVTANFWGALRYLIQQIVETHGDLIVLVPYSNFILEQVEKSLPDGTKMELRIANLAFPGYDGSVALAEWFNSRFKAGYLKASGKQIKPWAESNEIAGFSDGTLIFRWQKQGGIAWGAILGPLAFVVLSVLDPEHIYFFKAVEFGWELMRFSGEVTYPTPPDEVTYPLPSTPPPPPDICAGKSGIARWWCEATPFEKVLVATSLLTVFGGAGLLGGVVLLEKKRTVA